MALRVLGVPSAAGADGHGVAWAPTALPEGWARGLAAPARPDGRRPSGGHRPGRGLAARAGREPLAQFPHLNQSLSLADGFEALGALVSAPDLLAVVITEMNPDSDPDGRHVRRLVEGLTEALGRMALASRAGG